MFGVRHKTRSVEEVGGPSPACRPVVVLFTVGTPVVGAQIVPPGQPLTTAGGSVSDTGAGQSSGLKALQTEVAPVFPTSRHTRVPSPGLEHPWLNKTTPSQ